MGVAVRWVGMAVGRRRRVLAMRVARQGKQTLAAAGFLIVHSSHRRIALSDAGAPAGRAGAGGREASRSAGTHVLGKQGVPSGAGSVSSPDAGRQQRGASSKACKAWRLLVAPGLATDSAHQCHLHAPQHNPCTAPSCRES